MPDYTLKQHDNGVHYIHWSEGRRSKRHSTGQKEAVKAQIYLGEWLKGEAADQAGGASTFLVADLWNLYYEQHAEKNCANVRAFDTCWRNMEPHFGPLTLPQVTLRNADGVDKVEEYVALRETGEIGDCEAAPATIRHELSRLKSCFAWCAKPKQKVIGLADVPVFDLPPDSEPRTRWLRPEEIQKLLATAAERREGTRLSRVERFLWLALETGTRLQAALELTWDRVDFELGVIHFNVPGRKKTKKRRTSVPISAALRPVLTRAFVERESDYVLDAAPSTIWGLVKRTAKAAGVEGVSPHVLRHTAATLMLRNGVAPWKVAGVLAITMQTLLAIYGHHVPDGLIDAVDQISGGRQSGPANGHQRGAANG